MVLNRIFTAFFFVCFSSSVSLNAQSTVISDLETVINSIPKHFNDMKGKVISRHDDSIVYTSRFQTTGADDETITKSEIGTSYIVFYRNSTSSLDKKRVFNEYKSYFESLEKEDGYKKEYVELLINKFKYKGQRLVKNDVPLMDLLTSGDGFAVAVYSFD